MNFLGQIKAVFFDADDTIVELNGSLGKLYADVAKRHNVDLCADSINSRVIDVWNSIRLEYRNEAGNYTTSPQREKAMWIKFIGLLLDDVCREPIRDTLYHSIYEEFAYARSRALKKDVLAFVGYLAERDMVLGVLSNNDSRICRLLDDMQIASHFDHVIPTAEIGYKKPSPRCFDIVRERLGFEAKELLYIGDNVETDYHGARSAGWNALCFNEKGSDYEIDPAHQFASYSDLIERLKKST